MFHNLKGFIFSPLKNSNKKTSSISSNPSNERTQPTFPFYLNSEYFSYSSINQYKRMGNKPVFLNKKNDKSKKECNPFHEIEVNVNTRNSLILTFPINSEIILSSRFQAKKVPHQKLNALNFSQFFKDPLMLIKNCLILNEKIFLAKVIKKYSGVNFKINSKFISEFLLTFFSNEPLIINFCNFSSFDLIYITVVLYKKKFRSWDRDFINLKDLRKSSTKKRKDHIFKFFIKNLFSLIALEKEGRSQKNLKSFKLQNLSSFCFDNNVAIEQEFKNLFYEMPKTRTKTKKQNPNNSMRGQKLKNFSKMLINHHKFGKLVTKDNIDTLVLRMFKEYKRNRIPMHINALVNKLESESRNPHTFFKMIAKLIKNARLKGIWSFEEFLEGKRIFLEHIHS